MEVSLSDKEIFTQETALGLAVEHYILQAFLVFEPAMNTKFLRSVSIKLLERMRLEPT